MPGFAQSAAVGFFGFDGFSLPRLYDLLLGSTRGYFFLSPFLIAAVPGLLHMLSSPAERPAAIASGCTAWLVLFMVASLSYWHSGWGIASRYATLFIALNAIPLCAIFPAHRRWLGLGIAAGAVAALLATSVTATPPPPGRRPAETTVVGWLWDQLWAGRVAFRNENVLVETGTGAGGATWRTSFNLGQVLGLEGVWSLLPYLLLVLILAVALWWWTRDDSAGPSPLGANDRT
jgi:hypothetical protein